jgi:leucyl aminopeptidase
MRPKRLAEFKGKKGDVVTLFQPAETRIDRVVFFGLGKADDLTGESFRAFAGKAVKFCINAGLPAMTVATPSAVDLKIDAETLFGVTDGRGLAWATTSSTATSRKKRKNRLKKRHSHGHRCPEKGVFRPGHICGGRLPGQCHGQGVGDDPLQRQATGAFAEMIRKAATSAGLKVSVRDDRWLEKQKFGAMLAVGQGSSAKSRLVTVEYAPKGAKKTVVLVGKGVTFDSGGINLKPSGSIETMKMDMSGAATVAGTMLAVARIKPDVKVVGVMPLVENMPSGAAIRPGDIIRSYDGKTIEIGNTDAEGRLILVDAMAWAIKQYKPDTMIDLATLTGACVVALGEKIAGVFTKDQGWPMPSSLPVEDPRTLLAAALARGLQGAAEK